MELDELKNSWDALDQHLKDKELIKEEDINKLIRHTGKGINAIARLNIKLIAISLPILALILADIYLYNMFNTFYFVILAALIPAFFWDLFTIIYLRNTRADVMPLVEIVERVNRFHRWVIVERIMGTLLLLGIAAFSFVHWQVWQYGVGFISLFVFLWTGGLVLILWIYQRKFLVQIHEIKKNLDELKELM
ncbi:hypothetical protein [Bacteroides reticulotermitis]|uniref:Uncharacterized protein n=2 Tax=Bacteroides reticulotermitis TaxID=1133319 RepID=W4UR42_9BACE|nr:hypothetical protein [Bacteroides reticulotermitis]MBB4042997.1 hypothetical protein [Bacteroides reticulotermitis]GAE82974.1 hypothetical protein JCM10512_1217 [Bacteroides reticulotermitis JCM 10512]HJD75115.1 hypothetical protein [Bacteroides reticulotermitis]